MTAFEDRVFLNLWFAKPMVWVRVAFHENDGNHENDENDEDNSDSYKQGVECWIRGNHGNHENEENHENPGCQPRVPQTTGLEIPEKRPVHIAFPHSGAVASFVDQPGPARKPAIARPLSHYVLWDITSYKCYTPAPPFI